LRISVYSLSDAAMSFGIVQFEEGELGAVKKAVESMSLDRLVNTLRSIGIEVEEITVAKGVRVRGSWRSEVVYLSILGSSKKYWLEILDEFADFVCNESVIDAVNTVTKLLSALSPVVKSRGKRSIIGM